MTRLSSRTIRRISTAVTVPALAAGAMVALTAAPAHATIKCGPTKEQTSPVVGHVLLKACIETDGYLRRAYIQMDYARTYGGTDWDKFIVHPRLERNDADKAKASCNWTSDMNRYTTLKKYCFTPWTNSNAMGGWTGDGSYTFNFNLDGLGDKHGSLGGSPKVN
ncbi:hypothetical protein [Actinomadura rudentiformis]|uniref:Secreted protein n=1 Tax=Actinomadura rudentiformis TaxID=359158 RepID=A0A6H9YHM8_9ACTN|nr:hypothetical protein [Actinomadura rudentiformis]KAB2340163.1 hypothetical protein F8566_45700 [Actinomadura rudentiformis]